MMRTIVLSQQLQALSNPLMFAPQPMLPYPPMQYMSSVPSMNMNMNGLDVRSNTELPGADPASSAMHNFQSHIHNYRDGLRNMSADLRGMPDYANNQYNHTASNHDANAAAAIAANDMHIPPQPQGAAVQGADANLANLG